MTNTSTNKKNNQQNDIDEFNDPKANLPSSSDSRGQKRQKITLKFYTGTKEEKQSVDGRENSSQKEELDEKSSGIHVVYNNDNHVKPSIKNVVTIEKFNENEKRNKPYDSVSPNGRYAMEPEFGNPNSLRSPAGNEERKFRSNNSNLYASIVTREVEVPDKNGNIQQIPKNYMKVKVPKSPRTPTNNISPRDVEILPDDENNTPTSNRRRIKKKVSKNQGNDTKKGKPQLAISPENYNHTPTTMDGPFEQRRTKHRKNKNQYIPNDYNRLESPIYNAPQYIELEIVPDEGNAADERHPKKSSKGRHNKSKTPRHIHKRHSRHTHRGEKRRPRGNRSNRHSSYYVEYSDYDDYYDYSDEQDYNEYESDDGRRTTKRKSKLPETESNHESFESANDIENTPETRDLNVQDQLPTPTSTPTTAHVGTETKLIRNSSSTQTSFLHNNRATKSVETSSIGGARNDAFNGDQNEENTNENVFNSPKNSNTNDRSLNPPSYQNSFNSPRSPRSPRSPPPTYKSEVEGLTNSMTKSNQLRESPVRTRSPFISTNKPEEVPINRVPISSDDEDANEQYEPSFSSIEAKINQIGNRGEKLQAKSRDANINNSFNQKKQPKNSLPNSEDNDLRSPKEDEISKSNSNHSPKTNFLSESNSDSAHGGNDESYAECVLKPSQGSSVVYKPVNNSKLSTQSDASLPHLPSSNRDLDEVQDRNIEEEEKKESSRMSTKSSHSKPASKHTTPENSSLKGRNSHLSSSLNLDIPSQNRSQSHHDSLTTESTKQPSLINEGSSKKNLSSKVSFNSNMSRSSNKPSNVSKSTISIESEVQDFITPDEKLQISSNKSNHQSNSLLSRNSNISQKQNHSNLGSSIHSNHNLNGSSIHSNHNPNDYSVHSIHNSNGSNSRISEPSLNNKNQSVISNSASTFIDDKAQNQFSAAFDNLSEFTTSDPSERFIKKRSADIDSVIDSSITNNSEISIASPASENGHKSRNGSVLIEEIEEDVVEEELPESSTAKGGESSFSNLFSAKNQSNEESSDFNLFSSTSEVKSRKVGKRYIDPSEHYIKLALNVIEVKTRDPRSFTNDNENENTPFTNSIHEVQIEPAIPTKSESLFVQINFKDQDTFLSTPSNKCHKFEGEEEEQPEEDEAFHTYWNSNFLVTGFENSAISFTLCRREFSGFKMLASADIPLSLFKDISDGWFDLIPEEDDEEENPIISIPNSPSSKVKLFGKVHLVTNVESSIVLPPFDIDKQVEIIASRDQINLSNRNQEELDKIKAISFEFSSVSNNESSFHESDLDAQAQKLSRKFKDFREQFSSVSDASVALINSENGESDSRDRDGHRIKKRKINLNSNSGSDLGSRKNNSQADENQFNSSSSLSRRRKKENQNSQIEKGALLNDNNSFNSASSTSKRRIKVPKNKNNDAKQKTDSGLDDDLNLSAHSSSHGNSKLRRKDKFSSASEGQNFEFEKVSSSSAAKKKPTQTQGQTQNQSPSKNDDNDEIDNYLNNVSSTIPETITFDNSSTAVGASNFTLSGFQSPQKGNQNKEVINNNNINNNDDDDADESDGFHAISVFSESNNSDAPTNSVDLAEVKNGKTLSRDPPKRTHVVSSKLSNDDNSFEEFKFDDSN